MKCIHCGRGVFDGVALHRQNPKGEDGIWACDEHNTKPVDPLVAEIVGAIQQSNAGVGVGAPEASDQPDRALMEMDAKRYRWLRGPDHESVRYSRWRIEYWAGADGWQPVQRETMDAAIDAAMETK